MKELIGTVVLLIMFVATMFLAGAAASVLIDTAFGIELTVKQGSAIVVLYVLLRGAGSIFFN